MNHNISGIVTPGNTELAAIIMEIGNTNVFACYQCGNCSGGCPAADYMDLKPHLEIRLIQLGQAVKVLGPNTIGADVIVVCCPLCAYNLNALQIELMQEESGFLSIPVLFFTQVLALLFGIDPSLNDFSLGG